MTSCRLRSPLRVALVPIVAGSLLVGCKGGAKQTGASAAPVLTVGVQPAAVRSLQATLSVTGAIAAWQALPVSPAANGLQVVEVLADEGMQVKKGQVLARLDDRTLRTQLADANARLASAQASYAKAEHPSRPQDITTAQATVAQAKAAFNDAQASYNAFKELRAEGAVTATDLSAKEAALAAARANLQSATDRLTLARIPARSEDLGIARAAVDEARAARDQLEIQLSQTRVSAPADGLILTRSVLLGDVAAVGKPMFTLARDGRLEMDANVAEADLPHVHAGQAARVSSNAVAGLAVDGHVREISPGLNTQSRQALVKIDLPKGTTFRPGMFATATIDLGRRAVLAVPADAIINRDGKNEVFVVNDNVAHAREVQTGDASGSWVTVVSGLVPGDPLVVSGVGFLKEGDVVTVTSPLPVESPLDGSLGTTSPAPVPPASSPPR